MSPVLVVVVVVVSVLVILACSAGVVAIESRRPPAPQEVDPFRVRRVSLRSELYRPEDDLTVVTWQQVADLLPRDVLRALEDAQRAAATGSHVVRYLEDGTVTVDGVPAPGERPPGGAS